MPSIAAFQPMKEPNPSVQQQIGDQAPQAAWMTDLRGTVTFVNDYWRRYTGRTLDETVSEGWAASLRPEKHEEIFTAFMRSAASGGEHEVEFELRRHDGAYRWFLARAVPLLDPSSTVTGWTGLALDVHERRLATETARQREGDLRDALQVAEQTIAAKDEFLAKLSHELRTPLTPAMMTIQLLAENPSLDAEAQEDVLLLARNLDTEARLIDDLLDLTRILHGKLSIEPAPCDLHTIARDAIRVCGTGAAAKHLVIRDALGGHPVAIVGDAVRLQQVIWNLLSNAIKFTPENGVITLRSTVLPGQRVRLSVRDSGLGLEPARIAGLFEAFEQGGQTITRRFGGLGLGLSICKGIVELHGGTISAESAGPGTGAEFFFELPIA
jgi:PAS domain S-box-containing protein